MKAEQVSFATGEITPLLHARTDLAKYHTALAELVNMIVLPQGGITRRAGFSYVGKTLKDKNVLFSSRLIPFEYNSTDGELLEFGHKEIRVWQKTSEGYAEACRIASPYEYRDVKDLRYVQSGNVIFLAHRRHKPQMLRRNSLTDWSMEELPYKNGPWINGEDWVSGAKLTLDGYGRGRKLSSDIDVFSSGLVGTFVKLEYPVAAQTIELQSQREPAEGVSEVFEVKGTMNVTTSGDWTGLITIERSSDGGETWLGIRQYRRSDQDTQGQWDFTITETEENILYRVKAQHDKPEGTAQGSSEGGDSSGGYWWETGEDMPDYYKVYPKHPDIEGGENYVYVDGWTGGKGYVSGTLQNGGRFYYCRELHKTFYVVGRTSPYELYEEYGYIVDGYPEGYDENGNKTW